jgi:hypothetical protein
MSVPIGAGVIIVIIGVINLTNYYQRETEERKLILGCPNITSNGEFVTERI